jgi:hypothetical protein
MVGVQQAERFRPAEPFEPAIPSAFLAPDLEVKVSLDQLVIDRVRESR